MILDSSAIIAILAGEPERDQFIAAIASSEAPAVAAPTILETTIALARFGPTLLDDLQTFVTEARLQIVPFGPEHLAVAKDAFLRFGRASGHRARLNFGDCISYATAVVAGEPLLCKGSDFIYTDVPKAPKFGSHLVHAAAEKRRPRKRRVSRAMK